jgi:hypothetical protein
MLQLKSATHETNTPDTATSISYPHGPFTLKELKAANKTCRSEEITSHLAKQIALHRVQCFQRGLNDEPSEFAPDGLTPITAFYHLVTEQGNYF